MPAGIAYVLRSWAKSGHAVSRQGLGPKQVLDSETQLQQSGLKLCHTPHLGIWNYLCRGAGCFQSITVVQTIEKSRGEKGRLCSTTNDGCTFAIFKLSPLRSVFSLSWYLPYISLLGELGHSKLTSQVVADPQSDKIYREEGHNIHKVERAVYLPKADDTGLQ